MNIISEETLLNREPLFLNDFREELDVYREYEVRGISRYYAYNHDDGLQKEPQRLEKLQQQFKIVFADYTYEDYSGDSYVLGYDKIEGRWFEVHGSHCSCYGLEGQWEPEYYESWDILSKVIAKRYSQQEEMDWYFYRDTASSKEFKQFLKAQEENN